MNLLCSMMKCDSYICICICMYVYIIPRDNKYILLYTYIQTSLYTYIHTNISHFIMLYKTFMSFHAGKYTHTRKNAHTQAHTYTCTHIHRHAHAHACFSECMNIRTYVHMHMHVHISSINGNVHLSPGTFNTTKLIYSHTHTYAQAFTSIYTGFLP